MAKYEIETGAAPDENLLERMLTDKCYKDLIHATKGDRSILASIENQFMNDKSYNKALGTIRSCYQCQWRLTFPLPGLSYAENRACPPHMKVFGSRKNSDMDLRNEMVRKVQRFCDIRLNIGTVMTSPPPLQNEYFDTIIVTLRVLDTMEDKERQAIKPVTNSADLEKFCRNAISQEGSDRRLYVLITRGSDKPFQDLVEEIYNSRNNPTREQQLAMLCEGRYAAEMGMDEVDWLNLATVPNYRRLKVPAVTTIGSGMFNGLPARSHMCAGRMCPCQVDVIIGRKKGDSGHNAWDGGESLLKMYGICGNVTIAENALAGKIKTEFEVIMGTKIELCNLVMGAASLGRSSSEDSEAAESGNESKKPRLSKRKADDKPKVITAADIINEDVIMEEAVFRLAKGGAEIGPSNCAPAAASEFPPPLEKVEKPTWSPLEYVEKQGAKETKEDTENRDSDEEEEQLLLSDFDNILKMLAAEEKKNIDLTTQHKMQTKENIVLTRKNMELEERQKRMRNNLNEAKADMGKMQRRVDVAEKRALTKKFTEADIGRECHSKEHGTMRLVAVDKLDQERGIFRGEIKILNARNENLQKENSRLKKDL